MNDLINGLWELAGALCLSFSCYRTWRAKEMVGVSGWAVFFFLSWGLWNIYFYPSAGLPYSFIGGLALCAANTVWAILWLRYSR